VIFVGELKVIGKTATVMVGDCVQGEFRVIWRTDNKKEVCYAEKTFIEYVNKGWIAIGQVAGKKKQIFNFDPNLDTILLAPLVVGG
jgi:hypothetical protein